MTGQSEEEEIIFKLKLLVEDGNFEDRDRVLLFMNILHDSSKKTIPWHVIA
jgi:hypothetical protein